MPDNTGNNTQPATKQDVVPVLAHLFRRAFPWNQVTAGQSTNNLVDVRRYLNQHRRIRHLLAGLQVDVNHEDRDREPDNEFSGSTYRMINFIIDVPVRLDHLLERAGDPWLLQHGSIVYVGCEFQVVDQETAYLNEQGENSHANYKSRQRERVSNRLMWGLLPEGTQQLAQPSEPADSRPMSPLEVAVTESGPAVTPAPQGVPRAPQPALPAMPPACEEPTLVGDGPLAGPSAPLGFGLEEDSLLEPYRGAAGALGLADERTVVAEPDAVGEITTPGRRTE